MSDSVGSAANTEIGMDSLLEMEEDIRAAPSGVNSGKKKIIPNFGSVHVFEYSSRICGNPACQRGPAIGVHEVIGHG
jgi:hypothetical protein